MIFSQEMPSRFPSNPDRIQWEYRGGESDVRVGATKKESTAARAENYATVCDVLAVMLAEGTSDDGMVTIGDVAKLAGDGSPQTMRNIILKNPLPLAAVPKAGRKAAKFRYSEILQWVELHRPKYKPEFPATFAEAQKKLEQAAKAKKFP